MSVAVQLSVHVYMYGRELTNRSIISWTVSVPDPAVVVQQQGVERLELRPHAG